VLPEKHRYLVDRKPPAASGRVLISGLIALPVHDLCGTEKVYAFHRQTSKMN
jgi:hypothetical protein